MSVGSPTKEQLGAVQIDELVAQRIFRVPSVEIDWGQRILQEESHSHTCGGHGRFGPLGPLA